MLGGGFIRSAQPAENSRAETLAAHA